MTVYWKVHIDDLDDFIAFILSKYKFNESDYSRFSLYYQHSDHLYLIVAPSDYNSNLYKLSYTYDSDLARKCLEDRNWLYKGNFYNRKAKLEWLNSISKS